MRFRIAMVAAALALFGSVVGGVAHTAYAGCSGEGYISCLDGGDHEGSSAAENGGAQGN